MANIDWNKMTARYIINLYRALYSFKWLSTHWQNRRIKIREIDLTADEHHTSSSDNDELSKRLNKRPGYVEYDETTKCLIVHCVDGKSFHIKQLGIEGKRVMNATDFNNGFLKKVDTSQRYFS